MGREAAALVAEEISVDTISDVTKVLSLWISLRTFAGLDLGHFNGVNGGKVKAYYKHFVPLFSEGLTSSSRLQVLVNDTKATGIAAESLLGSLLNDLWENKLSCALSRMLTPVEAGTNLLKIPRVPEVQDVVGVSLQHGQSDGLCSVVLQGASKALNVVKANRLSPDEKNDGELNRRSRKYRDDAFTLFQTCYSSVCGNRPYDTVLLSITDQAFNDALEVIEKNLPNGGGTNIENDISIESCVLVCEALCSTPGTEETIVASFPLLCKLLQTDCDKLRTAAAKALGSADMRQVLHDARTRYETAERRASEAEKKVVDLSVAVKDLQRKNEMLQQQIAVSALHT